MKKTLRDIDVYGKKVLVRVDFNVPIEKGVIQEDNRIVEAVPTIKHLLANGASVILMSHLGRPEGKVDMQYTLKPCAVRLSELLKKEVKFAPDCIGKETVKMAKELKPGEVLLLENLRFHPEEEANDKDFAIKLSKLADVFVFDAFGTSHRKHASTYGVSKLMPSAMGLLVQKELEMISGKLAEPRKPFVAILGGAKVQDKIGMINFLADKVDTILMGGAMSIPFLKAQGYSTGVYSVKLAEGVTMAKLVKQAKEILKNCEEAGVNVLLPIDFVMTDNVKNPTIVVEGDSPNIDDKWIGADIGPETRKMFAKVIKRARTVIWNGPMGVFELPVFSHGTYAVAKAMARSRATTIVGGGDSASAVIQMGFAKKMSHISTGGGASLKLFEGGILPAVDVLEDATPVIAKGKKK